MGLAGQTRPLPNLYHEVHTHKSVKVVEREDCMLTSMYINFYELIIEIITFCDV